MNRTLMFDLINKIVDDDAVTPPFQNGFVVLTEEEMEHFADSIVSECCDLFEGVYTDQQRPERIDRRIKQHFGVE